MVVRAPFDDARGMTAQRHPVFTASDLGELINALPAMYGFPPQDSVVVLGLVGARVAFGMRLDLPEPSDIDRTADLAASHLEHQQVDGAIVIAVGEPLDVGQRVVSSIEARLDRVRPIAGGWATDERYWVSMDGGDPRGYAYRRSLDHPAATHAVWAGQEISPSREALAARVLPDEGERRVWVERAAAEVAERMTMELAGQPKSEVVAAAAHQFFPVAHDLLSRRPVDDGMLMRLGFAMTVIEIRDLLWGVITRDNARDMVGAWLHVARRVPVSWTPSALCLAAFASWLSGDGAMAVIAAERAMAVDTDYPMAGLMLALATSGVSPQEWEGWSQPPETWYHGDRAAS
jgi:hypothetical protein